MPFIYIQTILKYMCSFIPRKIATNCRVGKLTSKDSIVFKKTLLFVSKYQEVCFNLEMNVVNLSVKEITNWDKLSFRVSSMLSLESLLTYVTFNNTIIVLHFSYIKVGGPWSIGSLKACNSWNVHYLYILLFDCTRNVQRVYISGGGCFIR